MSGDTFSLPRFPSRIDRNGAYVLSGETMANVLAAVEALWGGQNIQTGQSIRKFGTHQGGFSLDALPGRGGDGSPEPFAVAQDWLSADEVAELKEDLATDADPDPDLRQVQPVFAVTRTDLTVDPDDSDAGAPGRESAIMFGRGEEGQPNEHSPELQNFWLRVDRIAASEKPPIGSDLYGRLDLRFNGTDAVLYGKATDVGGDHKVETTLDFGLGKLAQVVVDQVGASDEFGYWYLSTAADQRFISIDGRDASIWLRNEIDDYELIAHQKILSFANTGGTVFWKVDVAGAAMSLDGGGFNYLMGSGVVSASSGANYAELNANDGSVFCRSASYSEYMSGGIIATRNTDGTIFASLSAQDGSALIYGTDTRTFLYKAGAIKVYQSSSPENGQVTAGMAGDISNITIGSHPGTFQINLTTGVDYVFASFKNPDQNTGLYFEHGADFDSHLTLQSDAFQVADIRTYAFKLGYSDGSNTAVLEPTALTLKGPSSGIVSLAATDLPSGQTAYFQQVTLCVGGVSKTAYILMTTPA